jgi:SAM-dependent methyltransferase
MTRTSECVSGTSRIVEATRRNEMLTIAEKTQATHYVETASHYDATLGQTPEHELAQYVLLGVLKSLSATSLLDVGAGTGRAIRFFREHRPEMKIVGVEPSDAMRAVGYDAGIPQTCLVGGDGRKLPYPDSSFDVVTEFGVLHHVSDPVAVVSEMIRVARYAVYISDTNNLGQGGAWGRMVKNLFYWSGLWKPFSYVRTRGKGYAYEPSDGLWYYYTAFSHFNMLLRKCHSVHVTNTRRSSRTHWFSASHVALLAVKKEAALANAMFEYLR